MRKIIIVAVSLLFFSSVFGLISYIPAASAAAPSTSTPNDIYLNGTLSGTTGSTTSVGTQTLTLTAPESSSGQTINLDTPTSTFWTKTSDNSLATNNYGTIGTYRYYAGSYVALYGYEFYMGRDSVAYATIGTVWANLTIGGHTYSFSHTFNQNPSTDTVAEISASWLPTISSGTYSVSLEIQVTSDPGDPWVSDLPYGGQTSSYGNFPNPPGGELLSTYGPQGSYSGFMYGWTYSNTPSNSYTPSLPSGTNSYAISWTSQYSSILNVNGGNVGNSGTSGSYTESSSNSYPIKLVSQSNPDVPSYTGTLQVTADNKTSVSQSYNSGPVSRTIIQKINWWNASSVSKTIPLPSGWNSAYSFKGNITHILSVGYGTGTKTDRLNIGGTSSHTWNSPPSQYQAESVSASVSSGSISISANTSEFITYGISVTPTPVPYSSVEQSPVTVSIKYSSQVTLTEIQLYVNGNLEDRYTSPGNSGTASLALSDPSFSPLQVDWFLTTGEYSEWHNYTYGGATTPAANASSIIVMQSPNATHSYPITLSGVPYATSYPISITTNSPNSSLTYQQELQLNTSGKGIDSSLGNQLFTFSSNGTKAYAWIQSYNSTSQIETVWVKMYSDVNQTLNWNVEPSGTDNLNATGYLGKYANITGTFDNSVDNGKMVFPEYVNFAASEASLFTGQNYVLNNGLSWNVNSSTRMYINSPYFLNNSANNTIAEYSVHSTNHGSGDWTFAGSQGGAYDWSGQGSYGETQARIYGQTWGSGALFGSYYNLSKSFSIIGFFLGNATAYLNSTEWAHYNAGVVSSSFKFYLSVFGGDTQIHWLRTRTYVSSMPTASVGSGSNFQPSGYYQQEITITGANATKDGLNSQDSNFLITSSNGTTLYTWVQSISPNLTLWTKTPYSVSGSETLSMEVFPQFENLLSSTGFLGEAQWISTGSDNYRKVFNNYETNITFTGQSFGSYNYTGFIFDTSSISAWNYIQLMNKSNSQNGEFVVTNGYLNSAIFNGVSSANVTNMSLKPNAPLGGYIEVYHSGQYDKWVFGLNNTTATAYFSPQSNGNWSIDGNADSFTLSYLIPLSNTLAMPTASISSSGNVFMANATTTSSYPGVPGSYATNGTYQNMIYDIPIAPNTVYLTAIINSTWQFVSLYPSTYHVDGNMVLFTDLTGFASISIETIQPAQELGKVQESVTLSLLQNGNPQDQVGYQYTASYFSSSVTYTPYGSTSSVTLNSMGMSFSLPYGASAKVQVYDYWGEQVGSASFSVPQTSITVDVSVNVTLLYTIDNETGATFLSMGLRQGATNLSNGPDPMYVANGSSYEWYISTMNPQTFQNQLYSNTVTASGQTCVTKVPVGAPVSTLTVEAEGYNGSGLNQISNAGPASGDPTAYLYLNGVKTFFGQTFEGTYGETVSVRIADVLGHTLYSGSVFLNSPTISERYNITVPSYLIQFVNLEAVNGTSPLATQYSSISVANTTGPYYNFTTHVGLWSQIYLAAGYAYFVSTHDNLTATRYIDLTNQTVAYAFNGSSIQPMSESQFQASSAYLSVDVGGGIQGTVQANVTNAFTITVYLHKAALAYSLTKQQTEWVMANTTVVLQLDGVKETLVPPYGDMYGDALAHYVSPGILRVDVNISELRGGFSLNVTISNTTLAGVTVTGNGLENFGTVNYNPSNPPKPLTGPDINAWLHSPAVEVLGILSVVGGITAFGWKRLTRKETDEEEDLNQATLVVEGILAAKVMAGDPLTEMEQAWWNAIPEKTKQKLMHGGTAGKRTLFPRFKPTRLPGTGKR